MLISIYTLGLEGDKIYKIKVGGHSACLTAYSKEHAYIHKQ